MQPEENSAAVQAAIRAIITEIEGLRERMRADQEVIERSSARTRAILAELSAELPDTPGKTAPAPVLRR